MEDELQTQRYLCTEKLPRTLESRLQTLRELESVCNEAALSQVWSGVKQFRVFPAVELVWVFFAPGSTTWTRHTAESKT
jgi:hypothetical protein